MSDYLRDRQRTAPPIDRWSLRRNHSAGGVDTVAPMTLARGQVTKESRFPGDEFDAEVQRARGPWYHRGAYMPPGLSQVNWTAAGPARPELHVRQATNRLWSGNSRSRFPVVDTPTTGMHTQPPAMGPGSTLNGRYARTPQQTAARINRLSPGQYSGQTYSQITVLQGA